MDPVFSRLDARSCRENQLKQRSGKSAHFNLFG